MLRQRIRNLHIKKVDNLSLQLNLKRRMYSLNYFWESEFLIPLISLVSSLFTLFCSKYEQRCVKCTTKNLSQEELEALVCIEVRLFRINLNLCINTKMGPQGYVDCWRSEGLTCTESVFTISTQYFLSINFLWYVRKQKPQP